MEDLFLIQLGREQRLALAELATVLGSKGVLITGSSHSAMVTLESGLSPNWLQQELGGVVRIGRVLVELPPKATRAQIQTWLVNDLVQRPRRDFGMSLIDSRWRQTDRDQLGLAVKRAIKTRGGTARFFGGEAIELPSALVRDQLLHKGREYLVAWTTKGVSVAETLTIQALGEWSGRDFERPARDTRRGMLPPKLARIMINLGHFSPETTILDPFCGVGTVLQEAALLGFASLTGSDRDERAITATQTNLSWLAAQRPSLNFNLKLYVSGVEELHEKLNRVPKIPRAIVTEADLGPSDLTTKAFALRQEQFLKLTLYYRGWLAAMFTLLSNGEKCVLAYPRLREPETSLPILEMATTIGWQVVPIIPLGWQDHPATRNQQSPILSYARPDQLIGRQIVVLKKV